MLLRPFVNAFRVGLFAVEYASVPDRLEKLLSSLILAPLAGILCTTPEDKALQKKVVHHVRIATLGLLEYAKFAGKEVRDESLVAAAWIIATSPIYDYFFDGPRVFQERIGRLEQIINGFDVTPEVPIEEAMQYATRQVNQRLSPQQRKVFQNYLGHIHNAQKAELEARKHPTKDKLLQITATKGGYGTILGAISLYPSYLSQEEERAVYELGAFSQLIDDMRDAERDSAAGIVTPITEMYLNDHEMMAMQRKMHQAVFNVGMPRERTEYFLLIHQLYFLSGILAKHKYEASRKGSTAMLAVPTVPNYVACAADLLFFSPFSDQLKRVNSSEIHTA